MMKLELSLDEKLGICTIGRDDSKEDTNHFPYEPTPYLVLEKLGESGYLSKEDIVLDYGCGKGRVDFYLSWKLGCKTIGIDFDPHMIVAANHNKSKFVQTDQVNFIEANAETYEISKDITAVYFFNPFSDKILHSVLSKIKESWYEFPRTIKLFFYYPSTEYIGQLMLEDELEFVDEIDCADLYKVEKERERIVLFELII